MVPPPEGEASADVAAQSVALERVQLVDGLQREARGVAALVRLARELGGGGSYGETIVAVCRLTRDALGAESAAVLRWDSGGRAFATAAHDGMSPSEAEARADLSHALDEGPQGLPEPDPEAQRVGRLIAAPLVHAGRVYGLLTARRTDTAGRFDTRQVVLLEGIARQAGMALDNLRLLGGERGDASLADALLDVARELNAAIHPRTLLARLAARAAELTRADAAAVALAGVQENVYRLEAVHGVPGEGLVGAESTLGDLIVGPVDGHRLSAAWAPRLARAAGVDASTVSTLGVPLERGDDVIGAIVLVWWRRATPTPRQLAVARGLADQAAVVLQNVRLLDDIRQASRLKSEFVSTMSHELRTPLNVMMGYTDLLLDGAFGELDDEKRGVLARMQRSTRELLDLVTATLDLNRLEAGKSRVIVERVTVPELFQQLEGEVAPLVEGHDVALTWRLADGVPALETDRAKLRIVLKNLIGNAIKFTARGTVTVAAERSGQDVLFTVTDTGEGIRGEDLPFIFEMFRQLESATTRRHSGVGLGLYIVKRLLVALQGEVEVESEVGVGSRFRVRVPCRIAPAAG